jgi:hypothetical protein
LNEESITQQIDVFAADDEAILVVECKATDGEPKKGNFKEAIEALGGKKEGLIKSIRKAFPDSKHKIKFIFATKNYILSEPDNTILFRTYKTFRIFGKVSASWKSIRGSNYTRTRQQDTGNSRKNGRPYLFFFFN